MKKEPILKYGLIIIIVSIFIFITLSVKTTKSENKDLDVVRVGDVKEYSTLILFADEQGIFKKNGIKIVKNEFDSGAPAFKAFLSGDTDLTVSADFVGVINSFKSNDFKIITTMMNAPDVFELVARKDHGITKASDLRGKKIGLTKKTMGEFFLGTFLTFNNLTSSDVKEIDGDSAALSKGLMDGTFDAIVIFQPHTYDILKNLGDNATLFQIQGKQLLYADLYGRSSFIEENPDTVRRFVKSLSEAEQFMVDNPDSVKDFFSRHFNYSDDYIKKVLSNFSFGISLSQSMLMSMEDEARWAIGSKLTDKTEIPNFIDYLYFNAISDVKPESISIIR